MPGVDGFEAKVDAPARKLSVPKALLAADETMRGDVATKVKGLNLEA